METQNCKATQFYFGFRGYPEHGSTLQGLGVKTFPPPGQRPMKGRGTGSWLPRPNPVSGLHEKEGQAERPAMAQIGARERKEGAKFKNVESEGWFSPLH